MIQLISISILTIENDTLIDIIDPDLLVLIQLSDTNIININIILLLLQL